MSERLCEQKKAVASYCVDTANMPVLDANKWNLIAKLTNLLKVFHNTTIRLSERFSTASQIIPQIKFLELFIEKACDSTRYSGLGSTLDALKNSMKERFEDYLADFSVILATYFDPRYKLTYIGYIF
ncbi:UNVERIFIED_CONTAM: hypothetical protein RMT77_014762 [Armadillidium vulgare]